MLLEHFLPHCINRLFFSHGIRKKKSSFTSWWIKFAHFFCSLGDLPADVDLQTGVWGGGKAVCRQEVPLIYIFLFHRHINYVLILNFVKRSTSFVVHIRPWTQEHIQAFVSTFVYFFFVFLSTSTCMSMKHLSWVYCEHLQSELSCDEEKKWVVFSSTSVCCLENDLLKPVFNFDCYHKHSDCSYSISIQTMTFI